MEEKRPPLKEAKLRIKLIKRKYGDDLAEIREAFFCSTKGYTEEDFNELMEGKKKKEYLQKERECYFCSDKNIIEHHINYKPEKLIYLCISCHLKLHSVIEIYHNEIKNLTKVSIKKDSEGSKEVKQ